MLLKSMVALMPLMCASVLSSPVAIQRTEILLNSGTYAHEGNLWQVTSTVMDGTTSVLSTEYDGKRYVAKCGNNMCEFKCEVNKAWVILETPTSFIYRFNDINYRFTLEN